MQQIQCCSYAHDSSNPKRRKKQIKYGIIEDDDLVGNQLAKKINEKKSLKPFVPLTSTLVPLFNRKPCDRPFSSMHPSLAHLLVLFTHTHMLAICHQMFISMPWHYKEFRNCCSMFWFKFYS